MIFTNKTYDILKWIAQILLPALGTLYFGLAAIWNLPYGEAIVGTIMSLDAFLGVLLGISASTYAKNPMIGGVADVEDSQAKETLNHDK